MDNRFSALREELIENPGRWYYHGFPSGPEFLATAPDSPWNPKVLDDGGYYDYRGERGKKTLRPVCRHPIVEKWNRSGGDASLRFQIIRVLEPVDWTSVDIFRCGYEDEKDLPVVLLVSVKPGTITPVAAAEIAARCKAVLDRHELTDVSCEFRSSHLFHLNKLSSKRQGIGSLLLPSDHEYQLTDMLGTTICASGNPAKMGTKGPYLRIKTTGRDNDEASICALTCRHILTRDGEASEDSSTPFGNRAFLQPGDHEQRLRCLNNLKTGDEESIIAFGKMSSHRRKGVYIQQLRESLPELTSIWASYTARDNAEARTFGHVTHFGNDDNRLRSDWALIQLDDDKHEQPLAGLRNQVMIQDCLHEFEVIKHQSLFWEDAKPDENNVISLRGTVPVVEFQEPDLGYLGEDFSGIFDVPQCPYTLVVGKYGHGSQITFGLANQAFSMIRHGRSSAQGENNGEGQGEGKGADSISLAIGVTGYRRCSQTDYPSATSFCRPGDSGACVWDFKGRVAGIVTSGSGSDVERGATDVTYITPMEWILEDMKACGLEATLCD